MTVYEHARYTGRRLRRGESWCTGCAHVLYPSKPHARRIIREIRPHAGPDEVLRAWPCPHWPGNFHIGHDRHVEQAVMDENRALGDVL